MRARFLMTLCSIAALVAMAACSRRADVVRSIDVAGAERLARAAEPLRATATAQGTVELPRASWPPEFSALNPMAVTIAEEGVFVRLESRFTVEAGLFVAFAGRHAPGGAGTDPSFTPVAGAVYWYEVKG